MCHSRLAAKKQACATLDKNLRNPLYIHVDGEAHKKGDPTGF